MKSINADVLILGGGTAGMSAFRAARKSTDNVYLVEDHKFGTTCARVGCMPSKLLIAAADAAHHVRTADQFGVHPDGALRIDGRQVMERVRSERDRFVGFVLEDVEAFPAAHRILGRARFKNEHVVVVDDHTEITAQRIVIATGSRPFILPAWQSLGERLIVNDDVFDWETLPASVAVFGAGVIGLEIGQALHRLGVTVHVFGKDNALGGITDPVVLENALDIFRGQMDLHLDADTQVSLLPSGKGVKIDYSENGTSGSVTVDFLLAATGRKPNVDNLGLENLNIDLDARGVPKADPYTMQTSVAHIFIAGDASNQLPLLHEAADQGLIAGKNAGTFPSVTEGLRRSSISVVFSDPQIASIGLRFKEVTSQFDNCGCYAVGEVSFSNQGRSRVMGVNQGHLRIYAEHGSGRLLGAEMVGPAAEHLAHLLAWAHQQKMTVTQMLDMPFYHPVIEEGVRTALRDLSKQLRLAEDLAGECAECPGQ